MGKKWTEVDIYTGLLKTEDMPTNAAGRGAVAGIGVGPDGEPGVMPKRKKKKKKTLVDARTKAYREHRKRLETAREKRETARLKKEGSCVIIVGNSSYGNIVLPTDEIFSNIARRLGFKNIKIKIARKLSTSSQQLRHVDNPNLLRESLVYFQK